MISNIVNTKIPFKKKDNPFKPENNIPVINYVTHSEPVLNFSALMGKQTIAQHLAYEKLKKELDDYSNRVMGIKPLSNKTFLDDCRIQYNFDQWYKTMFPNDFAENKLTIDSLTSLKDECKYINLAASYFFAKSNFKFTVEV